MIHFIHFLGFAIISFCISMIIPFIKGGGSPDEYFAVGVCLWVLFMIGYGGYKLFTW